MAPLQSGGSNELELPLGKEAQTRDHRRTKAGDGDDDDDFLDPRTHNTRAVDPSNMGRWSRLVRWTSVAESCTQVRLTRSGLACLSFPSLSCLGVSPSRRVVVLRCVRVYPENMIVVGRHCISKNFNINISPLHFRMLGVVSIKELVTTIQRVSTDEQTAVY
ncbi:hypothetical protein ALC56_13515 [Trachymyrmex septentrionalis]|uniref:Uncharacterized protein n=1 Tax=Trachymyrmex septentrionalis TaxID=34720 RepID=A0A195EW68_9HYME|nr:hypothetical protein ALC56_13515 [Trachymyrmex septentrionalis]